IQYRPVPLPHPFLPAIVRYCPKLQARRAEARRIKPRTLLSSLTAAVTRYALLVVLLLHALGVYLINKQFDKRATVPAHLEAIRFNPFTLELALRNLHMGEPDAPQVAFDRLYANLQADSLWSGALHLRDVELEQAR